LIVEDDQIRHFPFIILVAVSQQSTANCQQRLFSRGSKLVARGCFRLFANSQQLKANSWLFLQPAISRGCSFFRLSTYNLPLTTYAYFRLFSRCSKLVARGFFRLFANSQQLKANSWLFLQPATSSGCSFFRLFSHGSKLVARGFFQLFAKGQKQIANSWLQDFRTIASY
jgi:hypothetical protein